VFDPGKQNSWVHYENCRGRRSDGLVCRPPPRLVGRQKRRDGSAGQPTMAARGFLLHLFLLPHLSCSLCSLHFFFSGAQLLVLASRALLYPDIQQKGRKGGGRRREKLPCHRDAIKTGYCVLEWRESERERQRERERESEVVSEGRVFSSFLVPFLIVVVILALGRMHSLTPFRLHIGTLLKVKHT
jgi:hypothetical protein